MLSVEEVTAFQNELSPIIDLQEKLLNIKEIDIDRIKELMTEKFTSKLSLRRVLSILKSIMYARPSNVHFYGKILSFISPQMKSIFDSHEVSSLFENKTALLILLQSKVITPESIIKKFNNRQFDINFFFPDIETAKKPKNINTLQNDEYRFHGQNEDEIATIIRNDKVKSLNKALRFDDSILNSTIRSSRYETFDFIESFGKKPSLIEYAAFFGSVNSFKYLLKCGAEMSDILPEFAVAGGRIEIIHLLEKQKCFSFESECLQAAVEFFQFELIGYFISTSNLKHSVFNLFESIKHFNYQIFIELIQNKELCTVENLHQCIFYAVEYQNIDALNILLKFNGIDVNVKTNFEVFILFYK